MRHSDPSLPITPYLYKSFAARQKNILNILKGGSIKETMECLIGKFFIYDSVAPNKENSHYFKNMIISAQQEVIYKFSNFMLFHTLSRCSFLCHVSNIYYIWFVGMGIKPQSPYEIKHKYLEMEYKDMEAYVN